MNKVAAGGRGERARREVVDVVARWRMEGRLVKAVDVEVVEDEAVAMGADEDIVVTAIDTSMGVGRVGSMGS